MRAFFRGCAAILCMLLLTASALGEACFTLDETRFGGTIVKSYESETLVYTIERFDYEGTRCYFTSVWMRDPAQQLQKATSKWHKNKQFPSDLAKKVSGTAMLAINGSGYVSP